MPSKPKCATCKREMQLYKGASCNPDHWEWYCDCPKPTKNPVVVARVTAEDDTDNWFAGWDEWDWGSD